MYGCRDRNQPKANQKHSESEISNFYVQKSFFISEIHLWSPTFFDLPTLSDLENATNI